jgi:hypothetical protein
MNPETIAQNSGLNFAPQKPVVKEEKKGFSLLDALIILAALFIVGFLGYLVINPDKQDSDTRNVYRSADVSAILTSISAYVNEKGEIPDAIPLAKTCVIHGNEICKTGPYDCTDLVDLSFLNSGGSDSFSTPVDPLNRTINGSGYYVYHDGQGLITVCAPYAERNTEISFSKFI